MAHESAERLSALDAMFLGIETHDVHMHTGSVSVFDAGPLRLGDGGIDIERLQRAVESAVSRLPRLRQRIHHIPVLGHPVWVDDPRFNLRFHLRHASLPPPGDARQLKRLAGRVMSQPLDRNKPLWEMWFVDGLEGNRFAQITKIHHCLIDGAAGVSLMMSLMSASADPEPPAPKRWAASRPPSGAKLLFDELSHRANFPITAMRAAATLLTQPQHAGSTIRQGLEACGDLLRSGLMPASTTRLNSRVGPYRRVDWMAVDLDRIKQIKSQLGGTVNDVVLACVAGALRSFLAARGQNVETLDFRTSAPVNTRGDKTAAASGNRVSSLIIPLPLHEPDPLQRLRCVIEATQHAKATNQALGTELLEELSDSIYPDLMALFGRLVPFIRPCNTIVTNVPGPPFPMYILGARLLEIYPYVPLLAHTGAAVALFSYCGKLFWGFNADWDEFPDLHDLVEAVEGQISALEALALESQPRARISAAKRPGPRKRRTTERKTASTRSS